ncbi:MAG TPA: WecB/TagA/CpsF family glycosyltransferase, partial [Nitrospiraceae bacterium]
MAGRQKGFQLERRVSGTDLMQAFFCSSNGRTARHFFYGDTEETLRQLTERLHHDYPGIHITGICSPPFRPLTAEEDSDMVTMINKARPDVLWVGLGLPKQERWIFAHRALLNVPLILGVGAAFKFLAGTVLRAPAWVGDRGFEWLWRLAHEPRRMWRRVFLEGPQFIGHLALEISGLRKYY